MCIYIFIQCFTSTSSNFTLGPFPFFNSSCRFRVIIANKTSLWVPTKPIRSWSLVRWSCNPGRNPKIQPDLAKNFVAVKFAIWILSCCLPQVDHKEWHSKKKLSHFSQLMIPVYNVTKRFPKIHGPTQHVAETTMVSKGGCDVSRLLEVRELCLNRKRKKPSSSSEKKGIVVRNSSKIARNEAFLGTSVCLESNGEKEREKIFERTMA